METRQITNIRLHNCNLFKTTCGWKLLQVVVIVNTKLEIETMAQVRDGILTTSSTVRIIDKNGFESVIGFTKKKDGSFKVNKTVYGGEDRCYRADLSRDYDNISWDELERSIEFAQDSCRVESVQIFN